MLAGAYAMNTRIWKNQAYVKAMIADELAERGTLRTEDGKGCVL